MDWYGCHSFGPTSVDIYNTAGIMYCRRVDCEIDQLPETCFLCLGAVGPAHLQAPESEPRRLEMVVVAMSWALAISRLCVVTESGQLTDAALEETAAVATILYMDCQLKHTCVCSVQSCHRPIARIKFVRLRCSPSSAADLCWNRVPSACCCNCASKCCLQSHT